MRHVTPAVRVFAAILALCCMLPSSAAAASVDAFTDDLAPNADLPVLGWPILFIGSFCDDLDSQCPPGEWVIHATSDQSLQGGLGGVLGGQRVATLTVVAGDDAVIEVVGSGQLLCYSSGPGASNRLLLEYGKTVDMNASLSANAADALVIRVIGGDLASGPGPVPCTVTFTSKRGTPQEATASYTQDLLADGAYPYLFSNYPGVDFTDVDAVTVLFDAGSAVGADFCIGPLNTREQPTPTKANSWGKIKAMYR